MAKRKSKTIIMDGYVKWARLTQADMDTKFDPRGKFTAEFYPETHEELDKALDEAEARGKDLTVKDPHDGEGYGIGKFIKIVRNNVNNTIEELGGPPEVVRLDEDGNMEPWSFDEDGLVGNGSKVRVKLDFYGEGRFAGSRLAKIGVMEHVPYAPEAKASGF
jgi:hypothetical protein